MDSVYELAHELGVSRISASLSGYFETLNTRVQRGAIVVTESAKITLDFDDFDQVGKQRNAGGDCYACYSKSIFMLFESQWLLCPAKLTIAAAPVAIRILPQLVFWTFSTYPKLYKLSSGQGDGVASLTSP